MSVKMSSQRPPRLDLLLTSIKSHSFDWVLEKCRRLSFCSKLHPGDMSKESKFQALCAKCKSLIIISQFSWVIADHMYGSNLNSVIQKSSSDNCDLPSICVRSYFCEYSYNFQRNTRFYICIHTYTNIVCIHTYVNYWFGVSSFGVIKSTWLECTLCCPKLTTMRQQKHNLREEVTICATFWLN